VQGEWPAPDTGEEMALLVSGNIIGAKDFNTSFMDGSARQMAFGDEFSEPGGGFGVVIIVEVQFTLTR
jgi:hypothetical protein